MSVKGVRSVDFLIEAEGQGVVNHNGAFPVFNPGPGRVVKNHLFPKLQGLDPLQRVERVVDGEAKSLAFRLDNERLASASLIVSSACIRAGIFRDASFGVREVTLENAPRILASLHGLVRGYLIVKKGARNGARKSPLYVTDFECEHPGLAYNQRRDQRAQGSGRESSSIFSDFSTASSLRYRGKASLSIEDLQFIPLENTLGRSAFGQTTTVAEGSHLADAIVRYLEDLAPDGVRPGARFVRAVRDGGVEPIAERGILLDDAAIGVIIDEVRALISGLEIRQGRGHLVVNRVVVDYNDGRLFRAARDPDTAVDRPVLEFAQYYRSEPATRRKGARSRGAISNDS